MKTLPFGISYLRLSADTDFPKWLEKKDIFTVVSRTENEFSIVCETSSVPLDFAGKHDSGWTGFYLNSVFDFSEIGILRQIADPLTENKISVNVVSTFDTDYFFVKSNDFKRAKEILKKSGHNFLASE